MRDRYVLLGVARARSDWFARVSRWTTAGSLPAEFLRCVSVAEIRARLTSGRAFSAVLADAPLSGVDRDLIAEAGDLGVPVIVVDDTGARDWGAIGAAAVLAPMFARDDLLDVLAAHALPVQAATTAAPTPAVAAPAGRDGTIVAVVGPGGTGASTVAIATAQGLAAAGGDVLLADLCRNAAQALLHDARVVVPGVQELVEAHRAGRPAPADVRAQTFEVADRGYRLLLGLRRPHHWVTIRPRAFEATLDALQHTFEVTVCDLDPEVEGEDQTGSVEVEERHLMTRSTVLRASAVLAVGRPGVAGLHALVGLLLDLVTLGVPAGRLVPVVVPAPRSPRARADITASLGALAAASLGVTATGLPSPLFLPARRVDQAVHDGVPLPRPLPDLLTGAVRSVLGRSGQRRPAPVVPERVAPGSLRGLFTSQEGTP